MSRFTPEMINAITELVFLEYAMNNAEDLTEVKAARVKLLFAALAEATPKSATIEEVLNFLFEKYGV